MNELTQRLNSVTQRIRAAEQTYGRTAEAVQLLAVSKRHSSEAIADLYRAGQRLFGESYLQEALGKIEQLAELPIEWHFIGPIQSNKTRDIASHFHWVHSVDRLKVARRLAEQRPPELDPLNVCLQINTSGEASKSGAEPEQARELAQAIAQLPNLRLRGLMTIPAPADEFEQQRRPFQQLREIFERLNADGLALDTLSMGMSGDIEAAIAEGSTLVRVGTALFGARG